MAPGTMEQRLAVARDAVRKETFGTIAWESTMQTVRTLVDEANASREPFAYTSVDGDIFAPR